MADRLKHRAILMAAVLLSVSGRIQAEALPDPTRPSDVGTAAAAGTAVTAETGPVLQTVIIPRKGKPKAVIGGELVVLGGKFGDQTLVRVSEREVVLEGPRGREVLKLTPGIEKKVVQRSPTRPLAGESKP